MTTLTIISFIIAIISFILMINFKMLADRQAEEHANFLREVRLNLMYEAIRIRMMYREHKNQEIILRKDKATVYATSAFKKSIYYKNDKMISDLLDKVMKRCYKNHVLGEINRGYYKKRGGKICEITLRSEKVADDLKNIIAVNNELEKYGLYVSLMVEY